MVSALVEIRKFPVNLEQPMSNESLESGNKLNIIYSEIKVAPRFIRPYTLLKGGF